MTKIAVIGFGVVGTGVVEIFDTNGNVVNGSSGDNVIVDKILDIKDFPESPYKDLLTKDPSDVFDNPEISIVVETMGGTGIAYEYTKRALSSGKHVVTSNKELVANHGPELLELAKKKGVRYLFEASVGGGIPIIRPMTLCLGANNITEIMGILNGTTNYVLTKMKETGMGFDEALERAQKKGYAEANPAADIEGYDACRKIAILSSIAYGKFVDYRNLYCEGITKVTAEDIIFAEKIDRVIKLVGYSVKNNDDIFACVIPAMLHKSNSLSNVNGVFNAIMLKGDYIGETMFYGKGAGKNATASAVVGDIIDVVQNPDIEPKSTWSTKADNLVSIDEIYYSFYIRYSVSEGKNKDFIDNCVSKVFDSPETIEVEKLAEKNTFAFVTKEIKEQEFNSKIAELSELGKDYGFNVLSKIRFI